MRRRARRADSSATFQKAALRVPGCPQEEEQELELSLPMQTERGWCGRGLHIRQVQKTDVHFPHFICRPWKRYNSGHLPHPYQGGTKVMSSMPQASDSFRELDVCPLELGVRWDKCMTQKRTWEPEAGTSGVGRYKRRLASSR